MRSVILLGLVLVLLLVALPALGSVETLDSGVTVVNGTALAAPGTPHAAVKYAEATTGVDGPKVSGANGSLNIAY